MLAAMTSGLTLTRRRSSAADRPVEKPLPPPPAPFSESASEMPLSPTATNTTTASPHSRGTGTSISSLSSTQRRIRKTWRGKACWIMLPLPEGMTESAGIKKPLLPEEVQQRMKRWEDDGFSIAGFDLDHQPNDLDGPTSYSRMPGQSRDIFPGLDDLHWERHNQKVRVYIPDKREWDDYVRQRTEEKLRALGVTRSDEDSGVTSPPISAMSRQASMQNSKASSVVGGPQSAGPFRNGRENAFSPPLSGVSAHITRPSSLIQPAGPHQPVPYGNHFAKQSVAFPGGYNIGHDPPFQPQPTPPLSGPWPHQQYLGSLPGSRGVSPLVDGRPVRSTHSPISPLPDNVVADLRASPNPFLPQPQPQRDAAAPQVQPQNVLHRQINDLLRSGESPPPLQQPQRFVSHPEIASPLPQGGHRHNVSETLQKEIDEAEQHLEESVQRQLDEEKARSTEAESAEAATSAALEKQPEESQDRWISTHTGESVHRSPAEPSGSPSGAESSTQDHVGTQSKVDVAAPGSSALGWTSPVSQGVNAHPAQLTSPIPSVVSSDGQGKTIASRRGSMTKAASKLSADAPEFKFDPTKASFTPMFTFGARSVSSPQKTTGSVDATRPGHSKAVSTASTAGSTFNVAAPAFTPSQFHIPSDTKREFSFTSAIPVSKSDEIARPPINGEPNERPRIFANFNYDDVIKQPKKSRAIPIVKPQLTDSEEDDENPEDEMGRITRPEGHQKRRFQRGGSGDQVPLFATPSREVSLEPPAAKADESVAASPPQADTPGKRSRALTVDSSASPAPAVTDEVRELVDDSNASSHASSTGEHKKSQNMEPEKPVDADVSQLTPESASPHSPEPRTAVDESTGTGGQASLPTGPATETGDVIQLKTSTLSASAKPFEFNPKVSSFSPNTSSASREVPAPSEPFEEATKAPAKKAPTLGLEGSRFAAPSVGLEGSRFARPTAGLEASRFAAPRATDPEVSHVAAREVLDKGTTEPALPPRPASPPHSEPSPISVAEPESLEARIANGVHYVEAPSPSYQEIDAVMQELDDSDAGVERNPTRTWRSPARSANTGKIAQDSVPARESSRSSGHGFSPTARASPAASEDPFLEIARPHRIASPSPNRLKEPFQYLPKQPQHDTESSERADALAAVVARNARFSPSFKRPRNPAKALDDSPVRRLGRVRGSMDDDRSISEWDDVVSSDEAPRFHQRAGFFATRVQDMLGGVVDRRLKPVEQSLATISAALVRLDRAKGRSRSSRRPRRSTSADPEKSSDADDEDDEEEASVVMRPYSPVRDRKLEKLKASVLETINSQKSAAPSEEIAKMSQELTEVRSALSELKNQPHPEPVAREAHLDILKAISGLQESFHAGKDRPPSSSSSTGVKFGSEAGDAKPTRGRSSIIRSSAEGATVDKLQLKVTGLESMLKVSEARADDELHTRQAMEAELTAMRTSLKEAQLEATQHREAAEETEASLKSFLDSQQQVKQEAAMLDEVKDALQRSVTELTDKNYALEDTLEEYRISHDNWKKEINSARTENEDMERTIQSLKSDLEEGIRSRGSLKEKMSKIQEELVSTARSVAEEQAAARQKIEEHKAKIEHQTARLEAEARTRERLELEIDRLEKQEKEAMRSRFLVDQAKEENRHLTTSLGELRDRSHQEQDKILSLERQLHDVKEGHQLELQRNANAYKADVAAINQRAHLSRANLEANIARLEGQITYIKEDMGSNKQRYELMLEEASISKDTALREAAEMREAAMQEHYRFHERTLEETRLSHEKAVTDLKTSHEQAVSSLVVNHERALSNAIQDLERAHNVTIEDKKQTESSLNGRLTHADEKNSHYQERIAHLEERLEIATSAAQAAAAAAIKNNKGTSPTPSVPGGSMQIAAGSSIPEKISPQALRESILVLQEQLRDRENQIEKLQTELGKVDHEAPKTLQAREAEIGWLRELLGVRLDELQDVTTALAAPNFDREAVRNAAIRLRANLEMERQEKERAAAGESGFPSIASITASPRALPMAAAAAWGNWRRGTKTSLGGLAEMSAPTGGSASQTPSRSSPSSFLSGLLTPPNTQARQSPGRLRGPPGRAAPRGAASSASRGRPSHGGFSTPQRKRADGLPGPSRVTESARPAPPDSPTLLRTASYDVDAESTHYSLDHYVSAATEDEEAVGLDEAERRSPEGEPADDPRKGPQAESDMDRIFGPSIELES